MSLKIVQHHDDAVSLDGKTYTPIWDEEIDWKKYSKAWHRQYGPARTISNRRVIIKDETSGTILEERIFPRWSQGPKGCGPFQTIINMLEPNQVPLLIGTSPVVDRCIERRLKRRRPCLSPASSVTQT